MKDSIFLKFLYETFLGRLLLKLMIYPSVSCLCGRLMDSKLSASYISLFLKKNNMDLSEYEKTEYNSFNEFFTRKILPDKRPVDFTPDHLISPCDAFLSIYDINESTILPIKRSKYTISDLVRDDEIAKEFEGGKCLVFRLCPHHYHRYIYVDDGTVISNNRINGVLHTVRPIACRKINVFSENTREYCIIDSVNFGKIIQMEIGAMMVGKIDNFSCNSDVKRGQEKGMFLFGGSTILLLLKPGVYSLSSDLNEKSVLQGQWIH